MDSLSQAALGATLAYAVLGRAKASSLQAVRTPAPGDTPGPADDGRTAALPAVYVLLIGAVLGTLPDLDVLVRYDDAVAGFTFHRSWSHSLWVLTIVSLPVALGLHRWVRPSISRQRWLVAVWLVLFTHPLLDGLTVYGTQLLWPLDVRPIAWGSVFIIDPLYTLPLLGAIMVAWRYPPARAHRWVVGALSLSTLYLGWTLVAKDRATHVLERSLRLQQIVPDTLLVAPFPFSVLWRAVAIDGDNYLEGYHSLLDGQTDIRWRSYPLNLSAIEPVDSHWPIDRLRWFTDGLVSVRREGDTLVMNDLRMGIEGSYVFRFVVAGWADNEVLEPMVSSARTPEIEWSRAWLVLQRMINPAVDLAP